MSTALIVGIVFASLWLFFIYGFLGVIAEMLYCWTIEYRGVIESRLGLLYLPVNPLYGLGGVFITLVLLPLFDNPFAVFGLGLLVGTTLEYVTAVVMEKAFHAVYWDYSKEFLNFQGRICLKYALIWGGLSVLLLYVLDTFNIYVLAQIPILISVIVLGVLILLFIASLVLTLLAYRRTEQKNRWLSSRANGVDATLPEPAWGRVVDRLVPDSVLINTSPRMSLVAEYQELTGHHRRLITWLPRIGRPSELRRRMGALAPHPSERRPGRTP